MYTTGGAAAPPPAVGVAGSSGLVVRINELQSENFSLRSRLQATVEELRVAQRYSAAKERNQPRAPSVSLTCMEDRAVQTEGDGVQHKQHEGHRALVEENRKKTERIAILERQLASLRAAVSSSTEGGEMNLAGQLEALREQNSNLVREMDVLQQISIENEIIRRDYAKTLSDLRMLESKYDLVQRQSLDQRIALGVASSDALPSPATATTTAADASMDKVNQFESLFRVYGKVCSVEEVERLLQQDEEVEINRRLKKRDQDQTDTSARVEQTLRANQQLRDDLIVTQEGLAQAHIKIEELTVALEMHSKYQVLSVSKSAEAAASESARQAAGEIAFLCDTLAATRAEVEHLTRKQDTLIAERDAAISSFEELRSRSVQLLQGCEEITSTARQDAEITIQAVQNQIRGRERELSILRGEILTATRQLDEQRQLKNSLESELIECRTKMLSIKDTCSTLRNETKTVKLEKQALLSQISNLQRQLTESQDNCKSLELRLATMSSSSTRGSVEGTLARNRRHARVAAASASPRRSTSGSPDTRRGLAQSPDGDIRSGETPHPVAVEDTDAMSPTPLQRQSSAKSRKGASRRSTTPTVGSATPKQALPRPQSPSASSRSVADDSGVNYRDEYEELKKCFLMLLPMVPGALTARDVANGLKGSVEKVNHHCLQLEAELRKKMVTLQQLSKAHTVALDDVQSLQKKVVHIQTLEKKLDNKDRCIDKIRKDLQHLKEEDAKTCSRLQDELTQANAERASLKGELLAVRQELDEGKQVMMQLLREGL